MASLAKFAAEDITSWLLCQRTTLWRQCKRLDQTIGKAELDSDDPVGDSSKDEDDDKIEAMLIEACNNHQLLVLVLCHLIESPCFTLLNADLNSSYVV